MNQTGFSTMAYTGMPLFRYSKEREDKNWIDQQIRQPSALFLPVWNHHSLVRFSSPLQPRAEFLSLTKHSALFDASVNPVYLGHLEDKPVFTAGILSDSAEQAIQESGLADTGAEFIDLRKIGPLLDRTEGAMLAYARGLQYWHQQNGFCSRCGSANTALRGGHMRLCNNTDCRREAYPHINPAVIMLVLWQDPADGIEKCLLGRHSGLPKGVYSTLAGYVDPGETLEEAVAREVMEEAGIPVQSATYLASQPWPFPSSMMFGFYAHAEHGDINLGDDELEDAQWFKREQLLDFGEYDDPEATIALPRKDSIARNLIQNWISGNV